MLFHLDVISAISTPIRVILVPTGAFRPNHPGVEPVIGILCQDTARRYHRIWAGLIYQRACLENQCPHQTYGTTLAQLSFIS
jgi:hypothetical protein